MSEPVLELDGDIEVVQTQGNLHRPVALGSDVGRCGAIGTNRLRPSTWAGIWCHECWQVVAATGGHGRHYDGSDGVGAA